MSDSAIPRLAVMLGVLVLYFVLAPVACQSPTTARKTLEDNGYTHIELTGYRYFICNDSFSTGFKAISPAGKPVSGAVCAGWFSGNQIRFD